MKIHQHASPYGTTLLHASAETRRGLRQVCDAVEAVLDADTFDAIAVKALAGPATYADAASHLLQSIPRSRPDLIPVLMGDAPRFTVYRCAVTFGVIGSHDYLTQMMDIEDLRSFATKEASRALIAAGEPVEWEIADRVERAVFTLRSLVNAMCGR